jgi:hypothetical protein
VRISDLISGKLHTAQIVGSIAQKINPLLSKAVSDTMSQTYWYMTPYAADELVFVGSPYFNPVNGTAQDFLMNSMNESWGTVSGMNPTCAGLFQGQLIAGNPDGSVIQMFNGFKDGDTPTNLGEGSDVVGRLVGSFLDYGTPNNNKRMLRVKIYGIADGLPAFVAKFLESYQYDSFLGVYTAIPIANASWDIAKWDELIWATGPTTFRKWYGTAATDKKVALQIAVVGAGATLLTDFESAYELGIGL